MQREFSVPATCWNCKYRADMELKTVKCGLDGIWRNNRVVCTSHEFSEKPGIVRHMNRILKEAYGYAESRRQKMERENE